MSRSVGPIGLGWAALLGLLPACASAPAGQPRHSETAAAPVVVLMTDFGLEDDAVGLMRGVILSLAPASQVVDLTHACPRFDVAAGSRLLSEAPGVYPPGSVFVAVVDPGVGTARRAIVARLRDGTLLVGPDNGLLSGAIEAHGPAEVRAVTEGSFLRHTVTSTFHGRDVFAPVGGHLAAGRGFEELGPPVEDWIRLPRTSGRREGQALLGAVEALDLPFGNVWTDLPLSLLEELGLVIGKDRLEVTLGDRPPLVIPLVATFGDVPEGAPLAYVNSRGALGLALNMGDFAATHQIRPGTPVRVARADR